MRKICVFTGGRAEYGILKPLIDEIDGDPDIQLQLLVSGMHMSPEFGLTHKVIEADGYRPDEKVEMLLSADTPVAVCKSMGLGMIGFSEALNRLKPDILVILGDRFESMAMATVALVCRIPIAHIQGGELTYGAIDDPIRHSITKMSSLHFTYIEAYRKRVIQLGEAPDRVFNVGGLNNEVIHHMKLMDREALEKEIDFELNHPSILITFHPVTLENNTSQEQFGNLLKVLEHYPNLRCVLTKTNADTEGRIVNRMIDEFTARHLDRAIAFTSMGQLRYLSTMSVVDVVIGNSSSGIIETPSFKVPTVNIGDRERGRIRAANIIDCNPTVRSIREALDMALTGEFRESLVDMENPYYKPNTAKNIKNTIKTHQLRDGTKKEFFDMVDNHL
ncbi:UDP-N-acetylglucosamine 2-epimerase [Thermodesulfobacteriota bacterium]